ncbi:alpha/beta fold hydrolase [Streptomyces sp. NPDC012693]|jgi:pimeloyl-ACP methyl ester carboxylesterase|uniref:alpha/beta fold hydrolase n=1 Tax=unclassified Streptomyces TaxID=2593676 RepID=UPI0020300FD4|nr:alpha/beta hydrolase [Streptomyces sp. MSC1_001]
MYPMAPLIRTALNTTARVAPGAAGRLAFHLFVRPLGRARVRPGEEALLATARTGHLQVRGKDVVTYTWGDGRRPVLVVHGWSSRASRLTALTEALLARGYSPVAFDAPGHGDSSGRASNIVEYRGIIRELHARHGDFDAVVAHSFGVLAALFALRDGVRTARFVGLGGVGSFELLLAGFRAGLGLDERVLRCMRDHVERRIAPDEPGIWDRFDADPAELGAPVLLFHDEDDDMVPLAQSRLLAGAHGDRARLVVTRGLGHRRILTDPEVVAEAVEFLTAPAGEEGEAGEVRTAPADEVRTAPAGEAVEDRVTAG